jgi:hypothetical protein
VAVSVSLRDKALRYNGIISCESVHCILLTDYTLRTMTFSSSLGFINTVLGRNPIAFSGNNLTVRGAQEHHILPNNIVIIAVNVYTDIHFPHHFKKIGVRDARTRSICMVHEE